MKTKDLKQVLFGPDVPNYALLNKALLETAESSKGDVSKPSGKRSKSHEQEPKPK